MLQEESIKAKSSMFVVLRLKDYLQLWKPNLSIMVVFSSVIGYLLAPDVVFSLQRVVLLFAGGLLVTGGANTINQILERYSDKLMNRTMTRPLPENRIGVTEAWIFALLSGFGGALLLAINFNVLCGILSFISLLLYAFAYTPLKKINSIAVFVGAIPGALPPLIGWVAATNSLFAPADMGGWVIFLIQFFWQFPHFWAIAWVGFDDYEKAGIRMLPSKEGRTPFTGLQCMFYSIILVPLAILPRLLHICNNWGMWIGMLCGIAYFISSYFFFKNNDYKSAKRVMFTSFIYLPTILLAIYFCKI